MQNVQPLALRLNSSKLRKQPPRRPVFPAPDSMKISDFAILREAPEHQWVGVQQDEVPEQFKGLRVLGQGVSSLALDKGDGNVILLTRDKMKGEWLDHLGIAKRLGEYQSGSHKIAKFKALPIYIFEMPKYERLDQDNERMVKKIITTFNQIYHKFLTHSEKRGFFMEKMSLQAFVRSFGDFEGHILYDLMQFVKKKDPDPEDFHFDLGLSNFMQKADGSIVVLDPVLTKQIADLMTGAKRASMAA
jgi:hypothetical protein